MRNTSLMRLSSALSQSSLWKPAKKCAGSAVRSFSPTKSVLSVDRRLWPPWWPCCPCWPWWWWLEEDPDESEECPEVEGRSEISFLKRKLMYSGPTCKIKYVSFR